MEISYDDIPAKHLPMVTAMVEFITQRLRLDATWDSLNISCSNKINANALIWVQWEIHHAHIKLNAAVLGVENELYSVLMHEFAHIITWPWAEAIDHASAHITDKRRRRSARTLMNRDYERVNNEIGRNLLNLLPWPGLHESQTRSAEVAPSGVPAV